MKNKILIHFSIILLFILMGLVIGSEPLDIYTLTDDNHFSENVYSDFILDMGYYSFTNDWRINNNSLFPIYLTFDEGNKTEEGSNITNYGDVGIIGNGILSENSTMVDGFIGKTYDLFANKSVITIPHSDYVSKQNGKDITVMFWFKDNLSQNRTSNRMLIKGNGTSIPGTYDLEYMIISYINTTNESKSYKRFALYNGSDIDLHTKLFNIHNDSWNFIGFTIDSSNNNVTMWLNDEFKNQTVDSSYIDFSNELDLHIGNHDVGGPLNLQYNGLIDEVRIIKKALTQDEIKAIYQMDLARKNNPYNDYLHKIFVNPNYNISLYTTQHSLTQNDSETIISNEISILDAQPLVSAEYNLYNTSSIKVYGVANIYNPIINLFVSNSTGSTTYSTTTTEDTTLKYVGDWKSNLNSNTVLVDYNSFENAIDKSNLYGEFSNHKKSNLSFYTIDEIKGYNATHIRISFIEDIEVLPTSTDTKIRLFNSSKPIGWFEKSITLSSGENQISARIETYYNTLITNSFTIYYDSQSPEILTSHSYLTPMLSTETFYFNITDDYGVNTTKTTINFTSDEFNQLFTTSNGLECDDSDNKNVICNISLENIFVTSNYNITIKAEDLVGRNNSTNITNILLTKVSKPAKIVLETNVTNTTNLTLYGIAYTRNINLTTYITDVNSNVNTTTNIISETANNYIYEGTITSIVNSTRLRINKTNDLKNLISESNIYAQLSNHNKTDLTFYKVTVTELATELRIDFTENLQIIPSSYDTIKFYNNSSYPDGWFNVSLENKLFSGLNTIVVENNLDGLDSNELTLYYDNVSPTIQTNLTNNQTISSNQTIYFNVTDEYKVNYSSINVSLINDTTHYPNKICSPNNDASFISCEINLSQYIGTYNLSINAKDLFNKEANEISLTNITITLEDDGEGTGGGEIPDENNESYPPTISVINTFVKTNTTNLYGIAYASNVTIITHVTQGGEDGVNKSIKSNYSNSSIQDAKVNGYYNSSIFFIERNAQLDALINKTNLYIEFLNHKKSDFTFYEVNKIVEYDGVKLKVELNENLENESVTNTNIKIYNNSLYPNGWFNISLDLFNGENIISARNEGEFGDENISNYLTVYYDNIIPQILTNHVNNSELLSTQSFKFNITDDYEVSEDIIINFKNKLNQTFNITNEDEDLSCNKDNNKTFVCELSLTSFETEIYDITINVKDSAGNEVNKSLNDISIEKIPTPPFILVENSFIKNNSINVYGIAYKQNTELMLFAIKDLENKTTYVNSTFGAKPIMDATITSIHNSTLFYVQINSELEKLISENNLSLTFSNHNKSDLTYYKINSMSVFAGDKIRIVLDEPYQKTISPSDTIKIYNNTNNPNGWFNATLDLYPGNNTILARNKEDYNLSNIVYVYVDTVKPIINTTHENEDIFYTTNYFYFNITDDYAIEENQTSITFNSSLFNQTYNGVFTEGTNFPSTNQIDPYLECMKNESSTFFMCRIKLNMPEDFYNITINTKDLSENEEEKIISNVSILSVPEAPSAFVLNNFVSTPEIFVYGTNYKSLMNITIYVQNLDLKTFKGVSLEGSQPIYQQNFLDILNETTILLDINSVLQNLINETNLSLKFSTHDRLNLTYYKIKNISVNTYNTMKITLYDEIENQISKTGQIFIYNNSNNPNGWFKIPINVTSAINEIYAQNIDLLNSTKFHVTLDDTKPIINTQHNTDSSILYTTNFNFNITDDYGVDKETIKVDFKGETINYNYTSDNITCNEITKGYDCSISLNLFELEKYNVTINAKDLAGNSANELTRNNILVMEGLYQPWIYPLDSLAKSSQIQIYGLANTNLDTNLTIEVWDENYENNKTFWTKDIMKTNVICNVTIVQGNYLKGTKQIMVDDSTCPQLDDSMYAKIGLINEFFLNNPISSIESDPYISNYVIINLTNPLTNNAMEGTVIEIHDNKALNTWFNVTVDLFDGENYIKARNKVQDTIGNYSYEEEIYYDVFKPIITTSLIELYYTSLNPWIRLQISDDYFGEDNYFALKNNTQVNITNGTHTKYYVWDQREDKDNYNGTFSIDSGNSSTDEYIIISGDIYTNFTQDGNYTIFIESKDLAGNYDFNYRNTKIKTIVQPVENLSDGGGSDNFFNRNYIPATWTHSSDLDLSHYQLRVIKYTPYEVIVDWFNVSKEINQTNITSDLFEYETTQYIAQIRPFDIYGNVGNITSSPGVAFTDDGAPEPVYMRIVPSNINSSYISSNSSISIEFFFQDNESEIVEYQYAIGTQRHKNYYPYNQTAWYDAVPVTTVDGSIISQTISTSLIDGEDYFLSVKAKDSHNSESIWYSTEESIRVDSSSPINASISYEYGKRVIDSLTIYYNTGIDLISVVNRSELLVSTSQIDISTGSCSDSQSDYNDYSILKTLPITSPTQIASNSITNLESGLCYRFALKVYDNVGNNKIFFTGSEVSNTSLIDTTPPSQVEFINPISYTTTTSLSFDWTTAIDNESGLKHYEYSFRNLADESILRSGITTTSAISFNNLPLVHGNRYYLKVLAYNNHNIASESPSPNILYNDKEVPLPLEIVSIGNDFNGTNYYVDSLQTNSTIINLTGEEALTCLWSFYDSGYVESTNGDNYTRMCDMNKSSEGKYSCEIIPSSSPLELTEGVYNVYVSCVDGAGNKQGSSNNKDIVFVKESRAPIINITEPLELSTESIQLTAIIEFDEVSRFNYSYRLVQDDITLEQGTKIIDNKYNLSSTKNIEEIPLNISLVSGLLTLYVNATDDYNRTTPTNVNFIVTKDKANVDLLMENKYVSENFTFQLIPTLYNYFSYNITNALGNLVPNYNLTYQNTTTQNISTDYIINANINDFVEGKYYINVYANNTKNTTYEFIESFEFIVDKTIPVMVIESISIQPSEIYEDDNIYVSTIFQETNGFMVDGVKLYYKDKNETANNEGYSSTYNGYKFTAMIPSSDFRTNESFDIYWNVTDIAQNNIYEFVKKIQIKNNPVTILEQNITKATKNVEYYELIEFKDEDTISQNNESYFNCTATNLPTNLTIKTLSNTYCVIEGTPNVTGDYQINVFVDEFFNSEKLDSDTKQFNLSIYDSKQFNVTLNSFYQVNLLFSANDTTYFKSIGGQQNEQLVNFYLPLNEIIDLEIYTDKTKIIVPNISLNENISFFNRIGLDVNSINVSNLNTNDSNYTPLKAELIKFTTNKTFDENNTRKYLVQFDYSDVNISGNNLTLFKYYYNRTTNKIEYSHIDSVGQLLTNYNDTTKKIWTYVNNFSIFILAQGNPLLLDEDDDEENNTPTTDCGNGICEIGETSTSCPQDCSSGGGSTNTGRTGGGSSFIPYVALPTCTDGIKNGNETGIDCGGSCPACYIATTETDDTTETTTENTTSTTTQPQDKEPEKEIITEIVKETEIIKEEKTPMYMWLLIGFLLSGIVVAVVVVKKRDEKVIDTLTHEKELLTKQSNSTTSIQDDIATISDYVRKTLSRGFTKEAISEQLIRYGYPNESVQGVFAAIDNENKIDYVTDYFNEHLKQGYEIDELKEWLRKNKIDDYIINKAIEKMNINSNTGAIMIDNSTKTPLDNEHLENTKEFARGYNENPKTEINTDEKNKLNTINNQSNNEPNKEGIDDNSIEKVLEETLKNKN